jgi:hypothetical protein
MRSFLFDDMRAAAGTVLAMLVLVLFAGPVHAETIHTGGETGAYHSHFCPALTSALSRRNVSATCKTSVGTVANMRRVLGNPTDLGYAQLDVFALKSDGFGGSDVFTRVRVDDARECVFAVTKAPDLTNYGEVAVFAEQLKFFLPPAQSGSTGTFRFLQELDPEGLGRAQEIELTGSADEAIRKALETRGGIAFFVQFPDAQNPRFKMIQDLGGHVVPVIDRAILAQEVDGQRIYHAQETQVTNTRWLRASPKVVTACTPLVLFTGAPETIKDKTERQNHADLISSIRGFPPQEMLPRDTLFARLMKRTKQLSAASADRLVKLSDAARERAKPLLERAKETGAELYQRAKEGTEVMIEKAKPRNATGNQ